MLNLIFSKSHLISCTACLVSVLFSACKTTRSSQIANTSAVPYCKPSVLDTNNSGIGTENEKPCRIAPYCPRTMEDNDGDGWGWSNNQSCRVAPICSNPADTRDGWGWENQQSCRLKVDQTSNYSEQQSKNQSSRDMIKFETTYYPFGLESYFTTACGDAQAYGGMYVAVTEKSPLWPEECELDSWASCADSDCMSKWDRIPGDAKREIYGKREVREPRCNVPCGKKITIYNEAKSITTTAVIYDACPSQHWNNRFKEVSEGKNPCAKGLMHLDLRKPLYQYLNGGMISDNIKVWVEPTSGP